MSGLIRRGPFAAALVKLLLVVGLFSCSGAPKHGGSDSEIKDNKDTSEGNTGGNTAFSITSLSRHTASNRSRQIAHVSYVLWFGLDANPKEFQGRTVVLFDLKNRAKDFGKQIALDLEGGTLKSILLNGRSIVDFAQTSRFDGHHIYFQLSDLLPTSNRIEISYSHPYGTDGNGLHRFQDPSDGKVYLYSDFEPYHAHRVFPCFDQPDLKASYELTVEGREECQVISNTLEHDTSMVDGKKSWAFPPSPIFSTYVFALHAGPYASWHADADGIPIRLFSRKSLAKFVDHKEWFEVTRKGLDFFGTQFGTQYPFTKYDQIIVPEFNSGAMENVGAVTFSERFVYQTKVTQDRRRARANVILHEMAHMWFGDLVTMRWWNGLWLNESFATFMASWAVDQTTSFKGSWQAFFAHNKQSAYWEDQLVTTHPIELPVPDTKFAEANFDGITYGKGAAVLKQLSFFLGEDDFREGLQRYFLKFAYKNTSLSDFIRMLTEASGQDLSRWQKGWLQTSGVNTIKIQWRCSQDPDTSKSTLSEFTILQSGFPLRQHKTRVVLGKLKGNKSTGTLQLGTPIDVTYAKESTPVPDLIGKPCPDFVYANFQDQDYAKIDLDETSLSFVKAHLSQIPDEFLRQMLWHDLWEMVQDGRVKAQEYGVDALTHIAHEKDTQVLAKVLKTLASSSANQASVLKFLNENTRAEFKGRLETFYHRKLLSAAPGSDLQLVWYYAYLDVASSKAALTWAQAILAGKQKLSGLSVDQERRWELIRFLARNGLPQAEPLIQAERLKDKSDHGIKYAIAAEAAMPSSEFKKKWLQLIYKKTERQEGSEAEWVNNEKYSLDGLRQAMESYQSLDQEEFVKQSVPSYFESLPKLAHSHSIEDEQYSRWVSRYMFPSLCDPGIVQRTNNLLDSTPDLPAPVVKTLKAARQEEERCIRARQLSSETPVLIQK